MDAILVPGRLRRARHRGQDRRRCATRASTASRISASASACRSPSSSSRATSLGLAGANCTEFDRAAPDPVIALITEWQDRSGDARARDERSDLGGTMRLGAQECRIVARARCAHAVYGRGRDPRAAPPPLRVQQQLSASGCRRPGLRFSGFSRDGLVEIIELPSHPWFIGVPVPPGVHVQSARRPSAVRELRARGARASRSAASCRQAAQRMKLAGASRSAPTGRSS